MRSLDVKAKNYFEFRKLLKFCYKREFHFSYKYNSWLLWIGWHSSNPVRGVSFQNTDYLATKVSDMNRKMMWLDTENPEGISFKQFKQKVILEELTSCH